MRSLASADMLPRRPIIKDSPGAEEAERARAAERQKRKAAWEHEDDDERFTWRHLVVAEQEAADNNINITSTPPQFWAMHPGTALQTRVSEVCVNPNPNPTPNNPKPGPISNPDCLSSTWYICAMPPPLTLCAFAHRSSRPLPRITGYN